MARAARGKATASSKAKQTKKTRVTPSAAPRGKGVAKGTCNTKAKRKVKVEAVEDEVENVDDDDDSMYTSVRDNSDDSDYQDEDGDHEGDSEDETADELDDTDSDFEATAKTKKKNTKRSTPSPKPAPKKPSKAASKNNSNGTPSKAVSGSNVATNKTHSYAVGSSNAAANEAAGAAARATGGEGSVSSSSVAEGKGASTGSGQGPVVNYVCEIAKTGRAMCRRCDENISKGALKVGVVTEGSWGPSTQWHHMQCTVFKVAKAEEVEGFNDLDDALQPLLEQRVAQSQGEVDDLYEPITPDDLVRQEWTDKAKCPDDIMATLLTYQAEGLAWMVNQEKLPYKGGILADEMGMGKTLQAICTIVANRPKPKDKAMDERWTKAEEEMGQGGASKSMRGGTLVVCPTIALKQWQSELARFVKPGVLNVVIYHGAKRATLSEDLKKADVVLTTYAIVENEHRKAYAGDKVACPDCGRSLYPDKMFTHRKYFCGEGAQRTAAQAKTQRKGIAPWRRKDDDKSKSKGKGKKGNGGDLSDVDGGKTTDIRVKVKAKGSGTARKQSATKRTKGGKTTGSDDEGSSDNGTTKVNVRVKVTAKAKTATASAASKRKSRGKARDSSAEETDDVEDAETEPPPPSKKRRSTVGRKSKQEEEGTTEISTGRRGRKGKGKGKGAAQGKGKQKRKGKRKGDDSDSDFEGTTEISGRGKKGKGKGVKRKRAAGESESEWSGDSDGSDSSDGSDDDSDGGEGARREAAFAKTLKAMLEKRDTAEPGVLQEISWQRIMLDEAHFIKDRSTSTAKAVFALTSLYKWCLTGTPLQNRVGELYSLVRFLRLDPHAFYQCRSKGCGCKSLNYRFGPEWRSCEQCGHTPIMHYAYFNRHILNPISRTGYVGEGKKAFLRLKREVLDQILLRRTKSNRSNDICLPPRIVRVRQHRLDEREEDFYQALYTQSQAQFDTYVDSGTILNNYAHIFDILIRLRQAVDHPYLVIYSATKREGMTPAMITQTPAALAASPTPATPVILASSRTSRSSGRKPIANGSQRDAATPTDGDGGGGGDPAAKKEGGGVHDVGDTSSDSESEGEGKRQLSDKGGSIGGVGGAVGSHEGGDGDSGEEDDLNTCGICTEPAERPVSSACGHSFCRTCVQGLIDMAPGDVECPTCSQPLTVDLSGGGSGPEDGDEEDAGQAKRGHGRAQGRGASRGRGGSKGRGGRGNGTGRCGGRNSMAAMAATLTSSLKKKSKPAGSGGAKRSVTKHSVINRIDLTKFQSSTKMEALMEEVHLMQDRDPAAKAIVFSQFVNMLDLIEYRMHRGQVGCRKLSGHLSVDKRDEVLQAFQNDPGVKVLLISLKAGGVALNLTVANHIFLMDPWWNPAAEMQAIDRTHRLGQFKPIYATRFIIEDTVEERIIKLQEKKQLVFDSTVGGDAASTGKLTVDDLRFLFAH